MNQNKHMRIGIVGAGPAGLTAAETLKEKGYSNVTVIEKSDRAGGKCRSFEYGRRWYELGAGILLTNNVTVRAIAKKYDVETSLADFSDSTMVVDAHACLPVQDPTFLQKIQLIYQGLKYRALIHRYHRVTQPGFSRVDPDLCAPFNAWASEHGIQLVAKEFAKCFTGFGYDFLDDVPAAYVLKYYSWETAVAYRRQKFYKFPGGIQHLWTEVAKHHRVLYDTTIQRIERTEVVRVTTQTETLEFDALILTSPLDEALNFLDASEEERTLFSQIQWCDYRVYTCHLADFPKRTGFIPENFCTAKKGHPVFWYLRYGDADLYAFYVLADKKMADEEIHKNIARLIQSAGGTIKSMESITHWKYFPHITGEQMKSGYYDRLEAIQGKQGTYYAGELLNFSTVEQSAWYAKTLVERFF